jgi:hypothetical protein
MLFRRLDQHSGQHFNAIRNYVPKMRTQKNGDHADERLSDKI